MTESILPIEIPVEVIAQVYREARWSFPAECCGWLSGYADSGSATVLRRCENAQAEGGHPTEPTRTAEHAYVMAGKDVLELYYGLESETPALVIYHSHPNGPAIF